MTRTEKIPFDFSLWGQPGISVYHSSGKKAVYVGETDSQHLPYFIHWDNKSWTWFDGVVPHPKDTYTVYMTREIEVRTLEDVVRECYLKEWPHANFDIIQGGIFRYSRRLLEEAQKEGIDTLLKQEP